MRLLAALFLAALLSACGSRIPLKDAQTAPQVSSAKQPRSEIPAAQNSGKYYANDGPPDIAPEALESTPDATPRAEPLHRFANRPYTVMGTQYVPYTLVKSFKEVGNASWYGRQFQGQKTANGEIYDLYAMTAAHPTAPLPSYARVTNLENGRNVVVRINDRGPFLHGRIIDLSYAAASKLGFARKGSARVEVELLDMGAASVLQPPKVVPPPRITSESSDIVVAGDAGEFYIQLGAFSNEANALAFLNKVASPVSEALGVAPQVLDRNGLARIRVGPYRSRDAASAALNALSAKTGITGVIGK
jgi:rare lipoprotein A